MCDRPNPIRFLLSLPKRAYYSAWRRLVVDPAPVLRPRNADVVKPLAKDDCVLCLGWGFERVFRCPDCNSDEFGGYFEDAFDDQGNRRVIRFCWGCGVKWNSVWDRAFFVPGALPCRACGPFEP